MRKKWLATLLSLAMVLSLLPTWAMAVATTHQVIDSDELKAAISSAADGDTIKLTKNISVDSIEFGKAGTYILDLNGCSLTGSGSEVIKVTGNTTLNIRDDATAGGGAVLCASSGNNQCLISVQDYADVWIYGGTFESQNAFKVAGAAKCFIIDGQFSVENDSEPMFRLEEYNGETGHLYLRGGAYKKTTYVCRINNEVCTCNFSDTTTDLGKVVTDDRYVVHFDEGAEYPYYIDTNRDSGGGTTPGGNVPTGGGEEPTGGNVLTVGEGGQYPNLWSVISTVPTPVVSNGDTIRLVSDILGGLNGLTDDASTVSFTLDLNGKTITGGLGICYGLDVTIVDSEGGGKIVNDSGEALFVDVPGIVKVEGGTFSGSLPLKVNGGGHCEIVGGSFETTPTGGTVLLIQDDSGNYDAGQIALKGGTFNSQSYRYAADKGNGDEYSFTNDVKDVIPEGYSVSQSGGMYTITGGGTTPGGDEPADDDVLTVGEGGKYETLAEAVAAATDGQTVTLLGDVELSAQLVIDKKLTIDLNGHTISPAEGLIKKSGLIAVAHGGDLTINDSSEGENGKITIFENNNNVYAAVAMAPDTNDTEPAILTVNGGTLVGYYYAIVGNGNPGRGNTHIVINDGTIMGCSDEGSQGIYNPQENSTLTVTGGHVEGYDSAVEMRAGTLNITGGTFVARATTFTQKANGSGSTVVGAAIALSQHTTNKFTAVNISGGEFTGLYAFHEVDLQDKLNDNIAINISDGEFTGLFDSENCGSFVTGGTFDANSGVEAYIDSDFCEMTTTTDGKYQIKQEENVQIIAQVTVNGVTKHFAYKSNDEAHNFGLDDAVAYAIEHDAVLELVDNGEYTTCYINLTEGTLHVKSNGLQVDYDVSEGAYIIFDDMPDSDWASDTEVHTETDLTNADENGKFDVGDTVTVNIVAKDITNGASDLLEAFYGAYLVVRYDPTYLTYTGTDPKWTNDPSGELVYWDAVGKEDLATDGVITALTFEAIESCVPGTHVTIEHASLLADLEVALYGTLYGSAVDQVNHAVVEIKLRPNDWKPGLSPSMEGSYQYSGSPVVAVNMGTPLYGTSSVKFYKIVDSEATEAEPKNVGSYKAVFTVEATESYGGLERECFFNITPADLTPVTEGMANTNLVYSGEWLPLLVAEISATGVGGDEINLTNIKYTFDDETYDQPWDVMSNKVAGTYTVTITANESSGNYKPLSASVDVTIVNPAFDVAVVEYTAGYSMVYVFTNGAAHFKYNGNKMYDVSNFGYRYCGENSVSEVDGTAYDHVYALLVEGGADRTKVAPSTNQVSNASLTAVPISTAGANDVNYNKNVGIDDAVLVASTYNLNAGGFNTKKKTYSDMEEVFKSFMAHILRADVDRNGVVEMISTNTEDYSLIGDMLQIKNEVLSSN